MISPAAIVKIAPAAKLYAEELAKQMAEAGIQANSRRAAMFLGQVHVESRGFSAVVEDLRYRPQRLLEVFPGRNGLNTLAQAQAIVAKGPAGIAEAVYGRPWGAAKLGNTEAGDGAKFIGRGLKQLTGRDNYRRFSRAWLGDESLLAHPERVADPDGAVASAVWFWANKQLNQVADHGDVAAVTRIVNGGHNALADRVLWTNRYKAAWSDRADFSGVTASIDSTEELAHRGPAGR
jgi:putative chitinase